MLIAKMKAVRVEKNAGVENIELHAVAGGEGSVNAEWASATPRGAVELGIANTAAQGKIERDKEYFVEIRPVEETGEEAKTPAA